ncbi:MAG TPA: hypothetical protein VH393_17455 [Ktedonobacterales bacterium]|jgi:hypothetical protein
MMHGAVSSQQAQDADAPDEPEAVSRDDNGDVALALALAQAARTVEHVVDLGAGRYGVAATYGPGQRVRGIVLRRAAQSEKSVGSAAAAPVVEAYLVVATAAITSAMAPAARQRKRRPPPDHMLGASDTPETPVLLRIAEETRRALAATLRRLRPNERWDIDITIDDLRDTDAGVSSGAQ